MGCRARERARDREAGRENKGERTRGSKRGCAHRANEPFGCTL